MIYTGVGSRKLPCHMFVCCVAIAKVLSGCMMRSGAATGADSAFEMGSRYNEIYLPYEGFNDHVHGFDVTTFGNYKEAKEIAETIHPAWNRCNDRARKMHSRNVYQLLGRDLDRPSDLVICWTPDSADGSNIPTSINTGGTGTAITLAVRLEVPVFNIANPESLASVIRFCGEANFLSALNNTSDMEGFSQLINHLEKEKLL